MHCKLNWRPEDLFFFFTKIHNMRLKRKHINVYISNSIYLTRRLKTYISVVHLYELRIGARGIYDGLKLLLFNKLKSLPTSDTHFFFKLVQANKKQLKPRQINYIKNMEIFRITSTQFGIN